MIRIIITGILLSAVILLLYAFANKKTGKDKPVSSGFAVVELFTSEGCSSCPPADEAVADIQKEYPDNVYVLGFHVDYWDYLGWKDEFSKAAFTKRQQDYASHFSLSSIYTPQVIVNGEKEFVGSNYNKLKTAVETAITRLPEATINLKTTAEKNTIIVNYTLSKKENQFTILL